MEKMDIKYWGEQLRALPPYQDFGIQKTISDECNRISQQIAELQEDNLKRYMAQTGLQPKEIRMFYRDASCRRWNELPQYGRDYWFEPAPPYMGDYVI